MTDYSKSVSLLRLLLSGYQMSSRCPYYSAFCSKWETKSWVALYQGRDFYQTLISLKTTLCMWRRRSGVPITCLPWDYSLIMYDLIHLGFVTEFTCKLRLVCPTFGGHDSISLSTISLLRVLQRYDLLNECLSGIGQVTLTTGCLDVE